MANELYHDSLGYRFAEFEFRARTGELRRQGQDLRLPEQAGRVLLALLRASGQVVTREELKQALWPGKTYGDFEGGLNAAVRKLRQVLGDDGSEPRLIGTLPKRGYRLLVPVEFLEERAPSLPLATLVEARSRWWLAGLFQPASGREFRALLHWAGEPAAQRVSVATRPVAFGKGCFLGLALLGLGAGGLVYSGYWRTRPGALRTLALPGGVPLELVRVPAGDFAMGYDSGFKATEPVHRVTLTQGFWMGRTEVTQAQWQAVMENNPSFFLGDDKPVEQVCWDDCQAFLTRLNQLVPDLTCRLPTEAEWEYSARAARVVSRYEQPDDYAWHCANSLGQTHPVGSKKPNPWGLSDLIGNVWEWCADGFGPYKPYPAKDPLGPAALQRSIRGGSWLTPGNQKATPRKVADRVTLRYGYPPDYVAKDLGFRIVAVPRLP